ncbi:MAG: preprotein translocase subunit SecE [Dehalococcoidia bacterium]|nr:preprotein translocase subunit SecE [Dehalococcoidia bacterium]MDW8119042.1 preprotein translocase subunit SecE [Chloroflexota bacterium]
MARLSGGGAPSRVTAVSQRLLQWRFLAETWAELKKVTWPSREDIVRLTFIVLALSAAVGVALGVVDLVFSFVTRLALGG